MQNKIIGGRVFGVCYILSTTSCICGWVTGGVLDTTFHCIKHNIAGVGGEGRNSPALFGGLDGAIGPLH